MFLTILPPRDLIQLHLAFSASEICKQIVNVLHAETFRSQVRAVPLISVGGGGTEGFLKGGRPNSELFYTIRLIMTSGRKGGWRCRILNYLPILPHHTFKWNGPK